MLTEVMRHFGLTRDLHTAGFYETPHNKQVLADIRTALPAGRMIVVTGIVGNGKTVLMRRLYGELEHEGRILVSRSLSIDKKRVTLPSLIAALFYDLSPDKEPIIPTQGEKRERALQALVRQGRKPVVLFVDEAHDLHPKTLVGLKRLMEVVTDGGGSLAILLLGHPKLRNDLRRPTMEEVGFRSTMFAYDGIVGHQREYIVWLLRSCAAADTPVDEMIEDAAVTLLAARLRTPLQIEQYLVLAFEEAFRADVKPITVEVVESVLSRHMDDLEPRLVRNGYDARAVADLIGAKPGEVRLLLQGRVEGDRAREMTNQMLAAGVPV
jgi:type II secretory pathway predicted ATPase ExeA